jgi:tetratricopeptide (TPR) repeat protein
MHYSMAEVLRTQRRYVEAISEYEAALAFDRNSADALADLGTCKTYIGPVDDAIPAQQSAIRLSPRDPRLFNWYFRIGEAHLIQSRVVALGNYLTLMPMRCCAIRCGPCLATKPSRASLRLART